MAKEILLFGNIYDFTAEQFINDMQAANEEDIEILMDTNGGDPQAAFGMIRKFQKKTIGTKSIEIQGRAYSMGAFFPCYVDKATALDVSDFLFHRAAYPYWIENDAEAMKEAEPRLTAINNSLRAALEAKIDVEKFERITNTTLDQLFSLDGRIDVRLNAKQAKQVKLIDEIIPITPEIAEKVKSNALAVSHQIAAHFTGGIVPKLGAVEKPIEPKTNIKNMDLDKLKAEHPHVYAQAVSDGVSQGVKKENERVSAFLVFADVDLKTVKEGIAGTEALSTVQMAELTRKSVSASYLKGLETDQPKDINTQAEEDDKMTDEEKAKAAELAAFEADVKLNLN